MRNLNSICQNPSENGHGDEVAEGVTRVSGKQMIDTVSFFYNKIMHATTLCILHSLQIHFIFKQMHRGDVTELKKNATQLAFADVVIVVAVKKGEFKI